MYARSLQQSQRSSATETWPLSLHVPVRNKSNAIFDRSRSGKRCIESISKSCSGKSRPDHQFFPQPEDSLLRKNEYESRLQIFAEEHGSRALAHSKYEGVVFSSRRAHRPCLPLDGKSIDKLSLSCVGFPRSNKGGANRIPRHNLFC